MVSLVFHHLDFGRLEGLRYFEHSLSGCELAFTRGFSRFILLLLDAGGWVPKYSHEVHLQSLSLLYEHLKKLVDAFLLEFGRLESPRRSIHVDSLSVQPNML